MYYFFTHRPIESDEKKNHFRSAFILLWGIVYMSFSIFAITHALYNNLHPFSIPFVISIGASLVIELINRYFLKANRALIALGSLSLVASSIFYTLVLYSCGGDDASGMFILIVVGPCAIFAFVIGLFPLIRLLKPVTYEK
jgi:hypothetical protein